MPSSIEVDWTDEGIIVFLGSRRNGDPPPCNCITEDPFSVDPWNAPDNKWYLCKSREPIPSMGEREIKNTSSGYWRNMGCDLKIVTDTPKVGRKVTWEFFKGACPSGGKTGFILFEYKLEKTEFQATDKAQDFNSLCRIFLHNNHMPALEELQDPVSLGDADGDYVQAELWRMLAYEEENNDSLESTYGSQLVKDELEENRDQREEMGRGKQRGLLAASNRSLEDSRPNHSAGSHAALDCTSDDFLEMNDLYDSESCSSSSDNSSCASQSSDGYFDSEALLRVIENENTPAVEGRHTGHNFSVSRSPRANRVVVQPPSQSSIVSGGGNVVILREISTASAPGSGPQPVDSLSVLPHNRNGGASRHDQNANVIDSSSQRAGTSQGLVTNRVGRIAKLGKKYFCFAS